MIPYSEEQKDWLRYNSSLYNSYEILTRDFNLKFNTNKSSNALSQVLTKSLKISLVTPKNASHYTSEEEKWLIDNYEKYETYVELVSVLNKTFNTNRTIDAVREKCTKRLKLKGKINITTFANGHEQEQCPIGTLRKSNNGCTYIKVKDSAKSKITGYAEPYWLPIQKKVWMDHFGEVPEGKMIIFLTKDRDNLDINNLYCIDRKISVRLAQNNWYSDDRNITLTAIKWCELFYAMKGE